MDIKMLAALLLAAHLISTFFMALVLIRQMMLFKYRTQSQLVWFRRVLFVLALAIFFGNFIPIAIDTLTITSSVTRSTQHVNPIGIAYAVSNALVFSFSAILIWVTYKMAQRMVLIVESHKLENEV